MYKIAIVEDEWESVERLNQSLEAYSKEYGVLFNITRFKNGLDFIEEYQPVYDMVFMDIDMPHKNGLTTAKELRKIDPSVVLVFVTFLAKYALKGYEVEALDYLIKPVTYSAMRITLSRAIRRCEKNQQREVILPSLDGDIRLELSSLNYVQIDNHSITYHTSRGEIRAYSSMKAIEKLLPEHQFCKCNRSVLVNLRNVTRIQGNLLWIGEEQLEISRPRRQAFLDALHGYSFGNEVF